MLSKLFPKERHKNYVLRLPTLELLKKLSLKERHKNFEILNNDLNALYHLHQAETKDGWVEISRELHTSLQSHLRTHFLMKATDNYLFYMLTKTKTGKLFLFGVGVFCILLVLYQPFKDFTLLSFPFLCLYGLCFLAFFMGFFYRLISLNDDNVEYIASVLQAEHFSLFKRKPLFKIIGVGTQDLYYYVAKDQIIKIYFALQLYKDSLIHKFNSKDNSL